MKKITALLCMLVLLVGCDEDKCEDMNCMTPPPHYTFELVDAETHENLFTNGSLDPSEIKLSSANGKPVEFRFISEDELNLISTDLGWDTENSDYQLQIGEELDIAIIVDTEHKTEDCCSFYEVQEFDIPEYGYEASNTTGVISIFVPAAESISGNPDAVNK